MLENDQRSIVGPGVAPASRMWNARSRVSIRRLETPVGRASGCEGMAFKDDTVEREWVFFGWRGVQAQSWK